MLRLFTTASLLLLSLKVTYPQEEHAKALFELSMLLDSADTQLYDYMVYRKAYPIYEYIIPKIIIFLDNQYYPKKDKILMLNRWYRSQQYYAKALYRRYGAIWDFSPIEELLSKRGIRCTLLDEDTEDAPTTGPFIPDNDLFLKYSRTLGDTILTSFLQIIGEEEIRNETIFIIIKCEKFISTFPTNYYTVTAWNKYMKYTSRFLSNLSAYIIDSGGEDHCIKMKRTIEHNRLYLKTYPQGLIASMVKQNLNQLLRVENQFCKETNYYKRMRMIKNLSY